MACRIRVGVFETNSSMVHSLSICSETKYEDWKNDLLVFNEYTNEFMTTKEYELDKEEYEDFKTFNDFFDSYHNEFYEMFTSKYTTENGEKIVAFGYYGHD